MAREDDAFIRELHMRRTKRSRLSNFNPSPRTVFIEDEKGPLKVGLRRHPSEAGSTGVPGPSLLDHQSERQFHGVIHDELDYYMTRLQEEIGLF